MALSSLINSQSNTLKQTENFLDVSSKPKITINKRYDLHEYIDSDSSKYYQAVFSNNKTVICNEINDNLNYDEYNMSLSWKEIESIEFPETEVIELDSIIVDEINEDDSDSWN